METLASEDPGELRPIADVWRWGFDLENFDPDLHKSFGPYNIDSVGENGEVNLVVNEYYYGDAPAEPELSVFPGSANTQELVENGSLVVGSLRDAQPSWHDTNAEGNRVDVTTTVGELTEMLTFPLVGPWSDPAKRRAVAHCVDPAAVAEAVSEAAGIDVPAAPLHVLQHDDPLAPRVRDVAEPPLAVDIEAARAAAGMELRVAAPYPSKHYKAMIASMQASCEPAGVRIVDTTGEGKTLADLPRVYIDAFGDQVELPGETDALIMATDPMTGYSGVLSKVENLSVLRAQENFYAELLPALGLTAQPVTFAVDGKVSNVVPYTGLSGIGWNMNRWQLNTPHPTKDAKQ